jgi:AcrR family transcriptional regulator
MTAGTSRRRPPAAYHHGNLQQTLIKGAERLLERDGVAGLSLRAVAREADVSHAAPYRHFRDKTDLLGELVRTGFDRLATSLARAAARHPGDPAAALLASGRAYVRLAVASPNLTTLMFGGLDQNALNQEQRAAGDRAFATLVAIVERGRSAGLYRDHDALTLAVTAWSAMHGLATLFTTQSLARATGSRRAADELAAAVGHLLLHGLLRR